MFSTNSILIDRLSSRLRTTKTEINKLISELFSSITPYVLNNKVFYMYELGYIYLDKNYNIIFRSSDISFDASLNTITEKYDTVKNRAIKKKLYEMIFENIRHLVDNGEKVYIENFGTFFHDDGYVNFEEDRALVYLVEMKIQNIKNKYLGYNKLLDRLCSARKNLDRNVVKDEINNLFENISALVLEKKIFFMYEVGNIFIDKNYNIAFRSADMGFDASLYSIIAKIDDVNERLEKKKFFEAVFENIKHLVDHNESIYIDNFGTFFYNKGYISFNADAVFVNRVDNKFFNEKAALSNENKLEMKDYSKDELLDISNISDKEVKSNKSKQSSEKKETKGNFILLKIAAVIVVIIAVIMMLALNVNNNGSNNVDNEKLYNIVNGYFTNVKTANLSYTVSNNMYYWDIAKEIYGNSTYWPIISVYNKYNIITPIKKGSKVIYKLLPRFCTVNDLKAFENTLSKSFIKVYPILQDGKKYNHAMWSLKLSAYYDIRVFKDNTNSISNETYTKILSQHSGFNDLLYKMSRYNKITKNPASSFVEIIKDNTKYRK
ncbi:hypothetical protein [Brachyspira pilosicoli]|uniref:hypothetical protein n=1 Tax=Brachyspira pilosicoli TaxID=52584 RepID=UPI000C78B21A|nr:hypothetical protein [Brachyspira pilosicoli]PLV64274.1 hypothetical protein BPSP16_01830 [Brachyspira pilosicoli SP16]